MQHLELINKINQLYFNMKAQDRKREFKLKSVFCALFPKQEVVDRVEQDGLPKVLFTNPIDYYCFIDTIGLYFKLVPVEGIQEGHIVFSWSDENETNNHNIDYGLQQTKSIGSQNLEAVVEHLY